MFSIKGVQSSTGGQRLRVSALARAGLGRPHRCLHPASCVARAHVGRPEGWRGEWRVTENAATPEWELRTALFFFLQCRPMLARGTDDRAGKERTVFWF